MNSSFNMSLFGEMPSGIFNSLTLIIYRPLETQTPFVTIHSNMFSPAERLVTIESSDIVALPLITLHKAVPAGGFITFNVSILSKVYRSL